MTRRYWDGSQLSSHVASGHRRRFLICNFRLSNPESRWRRRLLFRRRLGGARQLWGPALGADALETHLDLLTDGLNLREFNTARVGIGRELSRVRPPRRE